MKISRDTQFSQALTWVEGGHRVAIATVIETWGSSPRPVGAQLAIREDGVFEGSVSGGCVEGAVIEQALRAIENQECSIVEYGIEGDGIFEAGLACGGKIRILIQPATRFSNDDLSRLSGAENSGDSLTYEIGLSDFVHQIYQDETVKKSGIVGGKFLLSIEPPFQLIIIGAVHIAQFLAPLAKSIGYDVTVIDNRPLFGREERFSEFEILEKWPSDALRDLSINSSTAIVTLTHDDKFDIPALETALKSEAFYIGALGSRKTQTERNEKLALNGFDATRIHGPVGLNIGAKSPSEIAVSIMAEIISVMRTDG